MEGLLEQILSRLGAIEKKLGVASSGGGGDERSALAVDFEATIVKGVGAALIESCKGLGDDGAKMVRPQMHTRALFVMLPCALAGPTLLWTTPR